MMRGRTTVIVLASAIIYMLLCTTLYFATFFMVSWGEAKPWYLLLLIFVQDFPFNLIRADGEIMMSLIFVNALFWTLCIAAIFWLILVRKNKAR